MARQLEEDAVIVGVPSQDTLAAMQDFVDRHGLAGVAQAVDLERQVWARNGIPAQPAWVFVAPDGTTTRVLGALEPEELAERIDALSAPGGP